MKYLHVTRVVKRPSVSGGSGFLRGMYAVRTIFIAYLSIKTIKILHVHNFICSYLKPRDILGTMILI